MWFLQIKSFLWCNLPRYFARVTVSFLIIFVIYNCLHRQDQNNKILFILSKTVHFHNFNKQAKLSHGKHLWPLSHRPNESESCKTSVRFVENDREQLLLRTRKFPNMSAKYKSKAKNNTGYCIKVCYTTVQRENHTRCFFYAQVFFVFCFFCLFVCLFFFFW